MNKPICDFLNDYANKESLRLHMPGHKGSGFLGVEKFDITEIEGADVLYSGNGIISQSEKNASVIFDTQKTLYSTEGSSLSIRAMLYLSMIYAKNKNEHATIFALRNAHKSFMNAVAMLDVDVEWIYPSQNDGLLSCIVTPEHLEDIFSSSKIKPTALYVTSPDYLGNIANISEYSKICKKYDVLLLVDNAHGAYLAFNNPSNHPIHLGADMSCDSAHKTLPVLTGGGYLHISKNAPAFLADNAETAMQIFASTSPSYLILSSLDNFNSKYTEYKLTLNKIKNEILNLKNELANHGYKIVGDEILKLTIMPKSYGYTGTELEEYLVSNNIYSDFCDNDYVVMMISPFISTDKLLKLKQTLINLPHKDSLYSNPPKTIKPQKKLSIRESIMSPSIEVNIEDSLNKVLASANISCPPAIPIIVAGEIIDEQVINSFKYYGINKCKIIKEND